MATIKQRIDNVTENVTDGKVEISSAITDKGVTTSSNATFSTMANNIRAIETGAKDGIITERITSIDSFEKFPTYSFFNGVIVINTTNTFYSLRGENIDMNCLTNDVVGTDISVNGMYFIYDTNNNIATDVQAVLLSRVNGLFKLTQPFPLTNNDIQYIIIG